MLLWLIAGLVLIAPETMMCTALCQRQSLWVLPVDPEASLLLTPWSATLNVVTVCGVPCGNVEGNDADGVDQHS